MNRLDHDAEQYVLTVLSLYQQLPETPALPSSRDRIHAYQLQQRKLPLTLIETAFLLGSLRRLLRPPNAPTLSPIHSLAYFAFRLGTQLLPNPTGTASTIFCDDWRPSHEQISGHPTQYKRAPLLE